MGLGRIEGIRIFISNYWVFWVCVVDLRVVDCWKFLGMKFCEALIENFFFIERFRVWV